jgi:hypothetical protein
MAGIRFDASEAVRCTSIHARGGSIRTVALGVAGTGARATTVESAVTDMKSVRSLAGGWTNPILASAPRLAKLSHAVHSQRRRKLRLQATRKMNALTGKGRATASKVIERRKETITAVTWKPEKLGAPAKSALHRSDFTSCTSGAATFVKPGTGNAEALARLYHLCEPSHCRPL